MIVLAKETIMSSVHSVEMDVIKFSVMQKYAKKSAVLLKLNLQDTSLCFINCHLTSGADN